MNRLYEYQFRTRVDGHSYHDHQEGDFQVSNKRRVVHHTKKWEVGTEGSKEGIG
jgi:hypothetical protein